MTVITPKKYQYNGRGKNISIDEVGDFFSFYGKSVTDNKTNLIFGGGIYSIIYTQKCDRECAI